MNAFRWREPPAALTLREFEQFRVFIHSLAGMQFSDEKRVLLSNKLGRRLRARSIDGFAQYYQCVQHDAEERQRMLEAVCTAETHFFREPTHFDYLTQTLLPRWRRAAEEGRRARSVRAWSAACATGEEPYTLAMVLLDGLGDGWDIQVLATDLSRPSLEIARQGTWAVERVRDVPPAMRRFVLRGVGSQTGRMRAVPELQEHLRFAHLNLNDACYPFTGPFDLIFCRNVLIYFELEAKKRVLERAIRLLGDDGHLFLGHAESLTGLVQGLDCVQPTVYTRGPARQGAR